MSNFKELYQADMHRYADGGSGRYLRKVSYYLRKLQTSSRKNPARYYYVLRYISLCNKNEFKFRGIRVLVKVFISGILIISR